MESLGRELGVSPSTVGYWAKKHGLQPPGAARFAARGAPDRAMLEDLAHRGATLREMAETLDRSVATIRHWLRRWEIERPGRTERVDPVTAPRTIMKRCLRHGETRFTLEGRGYYRCMRCRQERVSERRRAVKAHLVKEAGGRCCLCGYARCVAALHFHHVDRKDKRFELSRRGVTRSIAEARAEARKCVLLCANCHAEVEAGVSHLDVAA